MHLIQQLAKRVDGNLEAGYSRYRQMLSRADAPLPGDADALAQMIESIGITTADVSGDIATLDEHVRDDAMLMTDEIRAEHRQSLADAEKSALRQLREYLHSMLSTLTLPQLVACIDPICRSALTSLPSPDDEARFARAVNEGQQIAMQVGSLRFQIDNAESADRERRTRMQQRERNNPRLFGTPAEHRAEAERRRQEAERAKQGVPESPRGIRSEVVATDPDRPKPEYSGFSGDPRNVPAVA